MQNSPASEGRSNDGMDSTPILSQSGWLTLCQTPYFIHLKQHIRLARHDTEDNVQD